MSGCCDLHDVQTPCCAEDFCCQQCSSVKPIDLPGFLGHQIRLAEFLNVHVCRECGSVTANDVTFQLHVRAHEMEAEAATEQGDDPCPEPSCTDEQACAACCRDYREDWR